MTIVDVLTLICATGCGLIAGVFFAFSTGVMKALSKLPASQGVATMQTINTVILNPGFLGVFIGTAIACAAALVLFLLDRDAPGSLWGIGGALSYLAGTFFVTIRFNVPRNERLARVDAAAPAAISVWEDYLRTWTAWNHLRTAASLAAAAMFVIGALLA